MNDKYKFSTTEFFLMTFTHSLPFLIPLLVFWGLGNNFWIVAACLLYSSPYLVIILQYYLEDFNKMIIRKDNELIIKNNGKSKRILINEIDSILIVKCEFSRFSFGLLSYVIIKLKGNKKNLAITCLIKEHKILIRSLPLKPKYVQKTYAFLNFDYEKLNSLKSYQYEYSTDYYAFREAQKEEERYISAVNISKQKFKDLSEYELKMISQDTNRPVYETEAADSILKNQ